MDCATADIRNGHCFGVGRTEQWEDLGKRKRQTDNLSNQFPHNEVLFHNGAKCPFLSSVMVYICGSGGVCELVQ